MEQFPMDVLAANKQPDPSDPKNFSRPFSDGDGHVSYSARTSLGTIAEGLPASNHGSTAAIIQPADAPDPGILPPRPATATRGFRAQHYSGDPHRAASRLGIYLSRPNSRFSITPAELPGTTNYQPISYGQLKEIRRIAGGNGGSTTPPPTPQELKADLSSEPPDGGFTAWAHAAAGFLICFNTL